MSECDKWPPLIRALQFTQGVGKQNVYQHMHVQHIYKSVFTQLTLKLAECIVVNKEGLSNTLPREMGEKAEAIKYIVCVTVSAKFHMNNK